MKIHQAGILVFLAMSSTLVMSCDYGWSEYNGHCYYVEPNEMDFKEAQYACYNQGAYLTKVTDQAESDFVNGLSTDNAWIGIRRGCGCENWALVYDSSLVLFTDWGEGEPNNDLGDEDCVEARVITSKWNDLACHRKLKSICEKDK
ncbi:perlucin-like protein [Ptychodera flava]|uniref:perlucin-like protein n=1 Tax=Ptychodera flava TaxID=63121 RepID=UPI003969CF09